MTFTDQFALFTIASWAATALAFIISLLVMYWVIRLAVTHGLRSHHHWLEENGRR